MLMALLYSKNEQIIAAAPACDQVPMGNQYWFEVHSAEIGPADIFETAYVTVANPDLCAQLMLIGIDQTVDAINLANQINLSELPTYSPKAA